MVEATNFKNDLNECVSVASTASLSTWNSECSDYDAVGELLGLNLDFNALYNFQRQLGQGSYGTVWAASLVSDPKQVYAVKVIDRNNQKKREEAVFREVELLQELQDLRHVVPVIDFMVEPQSIYVVQQYARGGDLARRLAEKKFFTEQEVRSIAVTLFETLDVMHTKHAIVHRDLKPENMLLSDAMTDQVLLADFGLAKKVPKEGLKTKCGTPAFVAPEIILGKRYHQPIDMWSIGCILFMMIGGSPPFQIEGVKDIGAYFQKIRSGNFSFHQDRWKFVSVHCKRLIARLLIVSPTARYTARMALESDWIKGAGRKTLKRGVATAEPAWDNNFNGPFQSAMQVVRVAVSAIA